MIVCSLYYPDMAPEVIGAQKHVIARFLRGTDFGFVHYKATDHGLGMTQITRHLSDNYPNESVLWLDIDCIPLSAEALHTMSMKGFAGCAQRANHIDNGGHIYVSPFCMHLPLSFYRDMGSPDFGATAKGDVGESLTYIAEMNDYPVELSWPVHCVSPMWKLTDQTKFGIGTTYDNGFYHNFHSRDPKARQLFIDKCASV
jgi:hypothetical protein